MGLVSRQAAIRVVYFATILFLGTGLLGISHNFYWNAKPVATMALGSVFSTLQFVPLILLTVEAWRFKNMPKIAVGDVGINQLNNFGFPEVFKFLVAVNFWNFFGAGVLGIIINLPIMNYFCLLYTSDAADERSSVDLGGRRIIKKKQRCRLSEEAYRKSK